MQPNISDISPSEGSPLGGDIVRIIGQNFGPQVAVYFGGFPCSRDCFAPRDSRAKHDLGRAHGPGSPWCG